MIRLLSFIVVLLLSCAHFALGQEQAILASPVILVNKPKQPANKIHQYSSLYFKFDLSKQQFPFSKVRLVLPIKSASKGVLYLKASSNWIAKKLQWAKRPILSGAVLAKFNVTSKQVEISKELLDVFKNPQIYSFSIYGVRGTKVGLKTTKGKTFYPKIIFSKPIVAPTIAITTPPPITATAAATPIILTATPTSTPTITATPLPFISNINISRGPYLQRGSPTSIIVRWRTDVAGLSSVYYGTATYLLSSSASDSATTTEHRVEITGLTPNTTYYYRVGNDLGTYQTPDSDQFFVTAPSPDSRKDTRVWVLGDSGTANASARAVRDSYINFTASRHTDFWLMLGDNAYYTGTDAEFQNAVFNTYPNILKNSVLWPCVGNHDASDAASISHATPYFDIFSLPRNAEAGGVPSGTESYYSFDYGDIHFISLNSTGAAHRANPGPMNTWLINDLAAAANKKWIVAFWHHAPYSKGSHNSNTEIELKQMRENILPTLENGGVDLVLSGHSHTYERSYLIDGYYGLTTDFNNSYKKSTSGGTLSSGGIYTKNSFATHAGTIYAVAGTSGQTEAAALDHPAMYNSQSRLGSVVLDFTANNLNFQFISSTGLVADAFTIQKTP